jgi:integrase
VLIQGFLALLAFSSYPEQSFSVWIQCGDVKHRTGYIFREKLSAKDRSAKLAPRWIARITWTDVAGKRRERRRYVENRSEGKRLLEKWAYELASPAGEKLFDGGRISFRKLAEIYEAHKLKAPVMKGAARIGGMRSWKLQKGFLEPILTHFGSKTISRITHADLEHYRELRLQTPTKHGKARSLAQPHRELQLLRAMLNFAKRQGWLSRTPFEMGSPVIRHGDEPKRDRILTRDEEGRLLAACVGPRAHLRPMLVFLLDTACRKNEMLTLRWYDIDLENGLVTIRAEVTKSLKPRIIGITARLKRELEAIPFTSPGDLVFGHTGNPRSAFTTACRLAGVSDFRIHDARHTACSRWVNDFGLSIPEAMRLAGWTTANVGFRYMNINEETARKAAEAMDRLEQSIGQPASEVIN